MGLGLRGQDLGFKPSGSFGGLWDPSKSKLSGPGSSQFRGYSVASLHAEKMSAKLRLPFLLSQVGVLLPCGCRRGPYFWVMPKQASQ